MQLIKSHDIDEDTRVTLKQNLVTYDYVVELTWDGLSQGKYSYTRLEDALSRFREECGEVV